MSRLTKNGTNLTAGLKAAITAGRLDTARVIKAQRIGSWTIRMRIVTGKTCLTKRRNHSPDNTAASDVIIPAMTGSMAKGNPLNRIRRSIDTVRHSPRMKAAA